MEPTGALEIVFRDAQGNDSSTIIRAPATANEEAIDALASIAISRLGALSNARIVAWTWRIRARNLAVAPFTQGNNRRFFLAIVGTADEQLHGIAIPSPRQTLISTEGMLSGIEATPEAIELVNNLLLILPFVDLRGVAILPDVYTLGVML